MQQDRYGRIDDWSLIDSIYQYYTPQLNILGTLGFQHLCVSSETRRPWSVFAWFPVYLIGKIIYHAPIFVKPPFRMSGYYPVMICPETCCFAIPLLFSYVPRPLIVPKKFYVKYYTRFVDGTTVISVNVFTKAISDTSVGFYKYEDESLSLEQCYQRHQERVQTYVNQDRWLDHDLTFETFVRINQFEDQVMNSGAASRKQKSKEIE